jgi:hypothetical protein
LPLASKRTGDAGQKEGRKEGRKEKGGGKEGRKEGIFAARLEENR